MSDDDVLHHINAHAHVHVAQGAGAEASSGGYAHAEVCTLHHEGVRRLYVQVVARGGESEEGSIGVGGRPLGGGRR